MISRRQRALASAGALSLCLVGAAASRATAQQLAFPEAEGFGRFATGARGNLASSTVYHVTNLNDSGTGSFRDAVSQANRFVVFDVGGIVNLSSVVTFAPNLTIAGQTAPGGFALYGNRAAYHGADNLISRYYAVRLGTSQGREDAASMVRGHDMMFDHMSITWGVDGTFDINPDSGQVIDEITIQNSFVAQGLDNVGHSTGGLMTLGDGHRFSIIKSLFADNVTRNPKVRGENEFINNVVYGYQTSGYIMGDTTATSHANVEGNYFIEGPIDGSSPFASGTSSFHIYGNDNWVDTNRNGVLDGSLNTTYPGADVLASRNASFPTLPSMTAQQAVQFVMNNVGPNITRDTVDKRLVQEVASYGTLGGVIDRDSDLFPGYGTDPQYLSPRARLADTDSDGMPDNWETSKGLNPGSSSDFKNLNGGYARIEEYLNELGGYGTSKTAAAGGAWTTAATWGGAVPNFTTTAMATGGVTHAAGNAFARQLTLDGASTVSGGTLDVFDTTLVGAGANGSLSITGGTVSSGQIVLAAAGRTGSLTLSGGTLQTGTIASGGGTAALTLNGGTIRFTGVPNVAVPTTVGAAGGTLNTNGFSGAITGGLSGSGTLTKTGAGTITLGGNNAAYSGAINLNTGTLALATNAPNSSTGTITAAHGTTLSVTTSGASTPLALANGATVTITAGGLTYNGAVTGAVGTTLLVSNSSSGTSNFSIGGNLTAFAGTLDLGASTGNIRIGSSGSSLANFDVGDSTGTIRTSNDGTTNFGSLSGGANTKLTGSTNGSVASTYVIGANGASTTFAGTIGDGTNTTPGPAVLNITKTGTGTLTLSNTASNYTGATTVTGGTLSLPALANGGVTSPIGDSSSAAASLVLDGGTLRYSGGTATTDRAFTVGVAGGIIDSSGSGPIDFNSTGAVVAAGVGDRTLTLRGNNTGANWLRLGLVDPAGGSKLLLKKDGSGTWRLAGNSSTFTGGTTVNAGRLIATSGTAFGTGGLSVATGATAEAQAGLPTALTLASVATTGTGRLDLTNNAAVIRSMTPAQVQALVAQGFAGGAWNGPGITSSTAAGTTLNALGIASNGVLNKSSFKGVSPLTPNDVLVKYTYFGDSDLSGAVTLDDFTLFLGGYQSGGSTWFQGDYDYSGQVTLDDFTLFLAGYRQQGAPLSTIESMIVAVPMTAAERAAMLAAVQAIPEPTGLALPCLAVAAGLLARRQGRTGTSRSRVIP